MPEAIPLVAGKRVDKLMLSSRRSRRQTTRIMLAALCAAGVLLALSVALLFSSDMAKSRLWPDRIALRSALADRNVSYMRPAYASRHFKPIWLKGAAAPTAIDFIDRLEASGTDGLSPAKYAAPILRYRVANLPKASRAERIKTELLLSMTYAVFISDLHTPAEAADVLYTDPAFQPPFREQTAILAHLASTNSPTAALALSGRMNGFYLQMRDALSRHRRAIAPDQATENVLLQNLDRLRALPSNLGERFVLVNVAANRLWLYEDRNVVDTMKVVVGTADEQTPQMAALIRHAIFNPFWNVPPDITRDTFAPRLAANPAVLSDLRMDPWSDFTPGAIKLDPQEMDWQAIAAGQMIGWLRQRPGGNNAMGAVKFMFPNRLGIYLHDTPERAYFDSDERFFSAGCVRVEDAQRLTQWLYRGRQHGLQRDLPEQRIDLPSPVPVYLVYLTATPDKGRIRLSRDIYGRDRAPIAA
ncbi:L,D-transpeptidase family protein [Sphingomonas qomolangmaensis]|uniref:L,D-transpeptidase family protein n=1 Tax=Sphingomonas qomolangmaensis TaxID=2918765 RepID=A0ABY5L9C2_9SPHN|nr:L,D-transpeptidase family protein [Sphingomonas qomolangmaensis]UUL82365.1 L,D-transpeptidase family protein [Sphingomonas qomolangmaensis]